jgi:hypothetical protein
MAVLAVGALASVPALFRLECLPYLVGDCCEGGASADVVAAWQCRGGHDHLTIVTTGAHDDLKHVPFADNMTCISGVVDSMFVSDLSGLVILWPGTCCSAAVLRLPNCSCRGSRDVHMPWNSSPSASSCLLGSCSHAHA